MKKLFTILLLSVCLVSVPSCQKDSNGKGDDPNRLTSKEAKEYFEQHSTCLRFLSVGGDKPSGTKSALTENMIIDWDSAIESETTDAYFVEVPINMATPIFALLYDGVGHLNTNIRRVIVNNSLLIKREKGCNTILQSLVSTIGKHSKTVDSNKNRYCFSSDKRWFDVYQIYSTLDGNILETKVFRGGQSKVTTLIDGSLFVKVDSLGRDIHFKGISFAFKKNGPSTKGGGGISSGEDNVCPECGGVLSFNNYGFCLELVCNCGYTFVLYIDLDDYCSGCGFPNPLCVCTCPSCGNYLRNCTCSQPGGNSCPFCGVPGCNGQCGGGADSTGIGRPESCLITVNVNVNGGYVVKNPDKTTYPIGDNLTLTAYPYTGYSFFGWYENGLLISQNSTLNFIVSQDRTLLAVFEENL